MKYSVREDRDEYYRPTECRINIWSKKRRSVTRSFCAEERGRNFEGRSVPRVDLGIFPTPMTFSSEISCNSELFLS